MSCVPIFPRLACFSASPSSSLMFFQFPSVASFCGCEFLLVCVCVFRCSCIISCISLFRGSQSLKFYSCCSSSVFTLCNLLVVHLILSLTRVIRTFLIICSVFFVWIGFLMFRLARYDSFVPASEVEYTVILLACPFLCLMFYAAKVFDLVFPPLFHNSLIVFIISSVYQLMLWWRNQPVRSVLPPK